MVISKNLSFVENFFQDDLDFYDYKKTEAKYRKIAKNNKLDVFPHLCLKHAPKDYPNIAYDYVNYDGSKINNYLCKECSKR